MSPRLLWPLMLFLWSPALSVAASAYQVRSATGFDRLPSQEKQVWKAPVHKSEFADVPRAGARARCEEAQPPVALTTPNPILGRPGLAVRVKVSFIVGT